MRTPIDDYRPQRDGVTLPAIALWGVVSLLLHAVLLLGLPLPKNPDSEAPISPPLTAYLHSAPPQVITPIPPTPSPPSPPSPMRAPRAAGKASAPEAVIALSKPQPAQPASPPVAMDLSATIAANRRARGEAIPSPDVETAYPGVLSGAALKQQPTITFGEKPPPPSGGLFQIRRRGYDYAEFMFYGWNADFGRNVPQMIEVRKGSASDIDIAVIRKIIEIIRVYESGDFQWYSKRSGKSLKLSAHARDNAGLEAFMKEEFYEELHRYR